MIKKKYILPYFELITIRPMQMLATSNLEAGSTDGQGQGQFDANAKSSAGFDASWGDEETWVIED